MAQSKKAQEGSPEAPGEAKAGSERLADVEVTPDAVEWLGEPLGPVEVEVAMGEVVPWPTPIEVVLEYMAGPDPTAVWVDKCNLWRAFDLVDEITEIDYDPRLPQEAKTRRVAGPRDELAALLPLLPKLTRLPGTCPAIGDPQRNTWIVAQHAELKAAHVKAYTQKVADLAGITGERVRVIVREANGKKKAKRKAAGPFDYSWPSSGG